jgi:hypothetical protein
LFCCEPELAQWKNIGGYYPMLRAVKQPAKYRDTLKKALNMPIDGLTFTKWLPKGDKVT